MSASKPTFGPDVLRIDAAEAADRIARWIAEQVLGRLRRRGAVVALSGGVDSSVVAALCARALGPHRVLALLMPERESDPESLRLAELVASSLGIRTVTEDITPILDAAGCYQRRDDAIRQVVPEYGPGFKSKLVLPSSATGQLPLFCLVVESPSGVQKRVRLPLDAYLGIVAATSMKQRTRKQMEYYHADRLHYAVAGTPNRLEYDQGFFVKNGDGAADIKPIAHLYKSQVYQLAHALGIPAEITSRTPTTDTYPMPQTQEEFYFSLPYAKIDLCLYGLNHGVSPRDVAAAIGVEPHEAERVYEAILRKRAATRYQHEPALLVEPVPQVG